MKVVRKGRPGGGDTVGREMPPCSQDGMLLGHCQGDGASRWESTARQQGNFWVTNSDHKLRSYHLRSVNLLSLLCGQSLSRAPSLLLSLLLPLLDQQRISGCFSPKVRHLDRTPYFRMHIASYGRTTKYQAAPSGLKSNSMPCTRQEGNVACHCNDMRPPFSHGSGPDGRDASKRHIPPHVERGRSTGPASQRLNRPQGAGVRPPQSPGGCPAAPDTQEKTPVNLRHQRIGGEARSGMPLVPPRGKSSGPDMSGRQGAGEGPLRGADSGRPVLRPGSSGGSTGAASPSLPRSILHDPDVDTYEVDPRGRWVGGYFEDYLSGLKW